MLAVVAVAIASVALGVVLAGRGDDHVQQVEIVPSCSSHSIYDSCDNRSIYSGK